MFKAIKYRLLPTVFSCKIVDAKVVKKKGQVSGKQLSSFCSIAKSAGIGKIVIYCYKRGGRERLDFSRSISDDLKQRFRNGWVVGR